MRGVPFDIQGGGSKNKQKQKQNNNNNSFTRCWDFKKNKNNNKKKKNKKNKNNNNNNKPIYTNLLRQRRKKSFQPRNPVANGNFWRKNFTHQGD